jgi:hypothetical protein
MFVSRNEEIPCGSTRRGRIVEYGLEVVVKELKNNDV